MGERVWTQVLPIVDVLKKLVLKAKNNPLLTKNLNISFIYFQNTFDYILFNNCENNKRNDYEYYRQTNESIFIATVNLS